MLYIYTDGSARKNGRVGSNGGFGAVVIEARSLNEAKRGGKLIDAVNKTCSPTTNNREEMKAILWALNKYGKYNPTVFSDSSYCVKTFNEWMWNWKKYNWIKYDGKQPENLDLIQAYDILIQEGNSITLKLIPGHRGIKWNEVADRLATGRISAEAIIATYGEK